MTNSDTSSIAAVSGFSYHIRSAPALRVEGLTMVGDARDMERGVLHLVSPSHARYLPVQAIPQEMAEPDLIVDVADGSEILTTLHFCTIWRGMDRNPETWEHISFPQQQLAFLYNDIRLSLCQVCQRLHKYSCVLDQQTNTSLTQALVESGLAMCTPLPRMKIALFGVTCFTAQSTDTPSFQHLACRNIRSTSLCAWRPAQSHSRNWAFHSMQGGEPYKRVLRFNSKER